SSQWSDIPPGGNKATLSWDDGPTVALNEDKNGIVIQGNDLLYEDGSTVISGRKKPNEQYHIQTPKAGQYQVVLADGTKVWLNAASSLHYPSSFTGKTRRVELKGEAYFEVAKDAKPFIVKTADQELEVLGTHFNINAYEDENQTITTLLEGSVRVSILNSNASDTSGEQIV